MKKVVWALLVTAAIIAGMAIIISCGETNPGIAPAGAVISLVTNQAVDWTYSCHAQSNLPWVCYDTWKDYLISYCILAQENDGERYSEVDSCVDSGYALEDCAKWYCDDKGYWIDFIEDNVAQTTAQSTIGANLGSCGYMNTIVSAFVTLPGSSDSESGYEGGDGATGGTISGEVMNGIEVRFISQGGEMYKLSDIPGDIAPLANPYVTETDERGKADVKYRTPLPTFCDTTLSYVLSGDIGVSQAFMTISYMVDASNADATDDDDDDDDDNDTT